MNSLTITKTQLRSAADTPAQRDWWAPIWQGLVLDKEGRHYNQMGSAIWLFAYLILCADRRTGSLRRKTATISQHMCVKTRTIRVWLRILRQHGYVETSNSGRSLLIRIRKWKTYPQWHDDDNQSGITLPSRVTGLCHPELENKGENPANASQKSATAKKANDITLNKYILNVNVGEHQDSVVKEDLLARKICRDFRDEENLSLYQFYVRKYPREIIQEAYRETIKIPAKKIKKTRGALFTYLVKHYAEEKINN